MKFSSASISEKGPVRPINADAVLTDESIGFFAVADGVGSTSQSAKASEAAVQFLHMRYKELLASQSPGVDTRLLIDHVERDYRSHFRDVERAPSSTLTAVILQGDHFWYFNIGDSPVFLLTENTRLLTVRHTVVDRVIPFQNFSEMKSLDGSNILFNYLGSRRLEAVTYPPCKVSSNARVLICTDGLADFIDQDELLNLHLASDSPSSFLEKIKNRSLLTEPADNFSVVVVDVSV